MNLKGNVIQIMAAVYFKIRVYLHCSFRVSLKSLKWAVSNINMGFDLQVTATEGGKPLNKFTVKWVCSAELFLENE